MLKFELRILYICPMDIAEFFAGFQPVGKQEWLRTVEKSLKGKGAPEDFNWRIGDAPVYTPWVHRDDCPVPQAPFTAQPHSWEISECFDLAPGGEAVNADVLNALNAGTEALELSGGTPSDLSEALRGVHIGYIGLHLACADPQWIQALSALISTQDLPPGAVRGTWYLAPDFQHWEKTATYLHQFGSQLSGFRMLHIDGRNMEGSNGLDALVDWLRIGSTCFANLTARGLSADAIAQQLHLSVTIGEDYFFEMSRLRAFRLLWLHLLKAWGARLEYPFLSVSFHPGVYMTDDVYTNMVRGTAMCMAAVLGGATRVSVLPFDYGQQIAPPKPPEFGRRIARNIQHLLKLESHFEQANDPMAGSYHLEYMTNAICQHVWSTFQTKPEL